MYPEDEAGQTLRHMSSTAIAKLLKERHHGAACCHAMQDYSTARKTSLSQVAQRSPLVADTPATKDAVQDRNPAEGVINIPEVLSNCDSFLHRLKPAYDMVAQMQQAHQQLSQCMECMLKFGRGAWLNDVDIALNVAPETRQLQAGQTAATSISHMSARSTHDWQTPFTDT